MPSTSRAHSAIPRPRGDRIAEAHLAEVEAKTADQQFLAGELRTVLASCRGSGRIDDCRVIEELSMH